MASGLARHAEGIVAWRDGRLPEALVVLRAGGVRAHRRGRRR